MVKQTNKQTNNCIVLEEKYTQEEVQLRQAKSSINFHTSDTLMSRKNYTWRCYEPKGFPENKPLILFCIKKENESGYLCIS